MTTHKLKPKQVAAEIDDPELDFEVDVQIDPHALDVEWIDQPSLFMRYSKAAAEARKKMDEAKNWLEVVRAEVDSEIRAEAAIKGEKKPTESAIANRVLLSDRYQAALAEYNTAKFNYDLLLSAVRAMDQKKAALENLVRLQAQDYFSAPTAPRELTQDLIEEHRRRRRKEKELAQADKIAEDLKRKFSRRKKTKKKGTE